MYKALIFLLFFIVLLLSCNLIGKKDIDDKTMADIIEKIMMAHVYYSKQGNTLDTITQDSIINMQLRKTIEGILEEYDVSITDFQAHLDEVLGNPDQFHPILDTIYKRIDYYRK